MPSLARPPAAGLGSQSVLVAIPEVYLHGLYEALAWTHYRLRHGPDYEPTVVGSHVARNNRRPIHAHSTRRYDGDRPDISRQMAAGLLRVHLLPQYLPDDAERNRHCTREARYRRRQAKAPLHYG